MDLSVQELLRYNRHIIMPEIGIDGQLSLKKAKVLVVGAGGLGSPVLLYLAAAGIGTIGISDFDLVSESNLQRQILYSTEDIGKPKATSAAKKLKKLNPEIDLIPIPEKMDKSNILDWFEKFDIVVDCSDNFKTRYLTNDACVILDKPLVFGAIFKFEGQVSVFNYQGGPTYRCLFPEPPIDDESYDCSRIGVIGALPGIIGTMQALETIKMITGKGKVLSGRLLTFDMFNMTSNSFEFERDNEQTNINELVEMNFSCVLDDKQFSEISPEELDKMQTMGEQIQLLDIREKHEFEAFNIGGKNIPADDIPKTLNEISSDIVIVCWIGEKSKPVSVFLKQTFPKYNIMTLKGGIEAWLHYNNKK